MTSVLPATAPVSADRRDGAPRPLAAVRELHQVRELHEAARLLRLIWRAAPEEPVMPVELMRALSHAGNYVAGAYLGQTLAGVSVGFFSDGEHRGLHSHIAGVHPDRQGRGIGFALKQHQRDWALQRDTRTITWTFDPLVRRNAFFNLVKLGAHAVAYLPDFYGPMLDGINAGDASDRLLVRWQLDDEQATRASAGQPASVGDVGTVAEPPDWLLKAAADGTPTLRTTGAPQLLCQIPADIETQRSHDPARATAWRGALRRALQQALGSGYAIAGMTRDGCYLLEKVPSR